MAKANLPISCARIRIKVSATVRGTFQADIYRILPGTMRYGGVFLMTAEHATREGAIGLAVARRRAAQQNYRASTAQIDAYRAAARARRASV